MNNRIKAAIITVLIIGGTFVLIQAGAYFFPKTSIALVTKVIDGDTLIIEGGNRVRLYSIDATEVDKPCHDEAQQFLEQLVLGKSVKLEREGPDHDKYNRLLRWIWLKDTLVNEQVVSAGLAVARSGDGKKYFGRITEAEKTAMAAHIGCLWANTT